MRFKRNPQILSILGVGVGIIALACSSATTTAPLPAASAPAPVAASTQAPDTPTPPPTSASASAGEAESVGAFIWEIEEVDIGTKPALALTSDDVPNIAYMLEAFGGFVKNAARSGPEWDITTVAEGYFYGPLDIGIGPDDVPRVAYHDHQEDTFQPDKGDALLAVLENGEWNVEAIFDAGHDGWDTRIFVDADNRVHISAIDPEEFGGDGVEYYSQDSSGKWVVENIGSGSLTYRWATSVAVDPDGNPYVTYYDPQGSNLALASKNGSGWNITPVDSEGDTGLFSSLVIDADGRFHISYFERKSDSSGVVKYATRGAEDAEWEIRTLDELDDLVFGFIGARNITSLALDSQGNPWIAYSDEKELKLGLWDGSDWQIETVVDAGGKTLGQLVSMKLDSKDQPHITYFEVTGTRPLNGKVMYAKGTPN